MDSFVVICDLGGGLNEFKCEGANKDSWTRIGEYNDHKVKLNSLVF